MSTADGQAFAASTGMGETTLLFFDRYGTPVNQYHGVTTEGNLRNVIESTFQLRRSGGASR
ncbi:MAG: hypothetical protein GEU77_07845 [Deltaproteobacteria bacterium]|nr:hypothetical protein [Deltaproteobacteria bacterium]